MIGSLMGHVSTPGLYLFKIILEMLINLIMDPIELSVEDDSLFAANQSRLSTVAGSDYQDSIIKNVVEF